MNRRDVLKSLGSLVAVAVIPDNRVTASRRTSLLSTLNAQLSTRLGVQSYSYGSHWSAARAKQPGARFTDSVGFVEYCHSIGAGGVQIVIEPDLARRIRESSEALGVFVEGIASLPRNLGDLPRFEAQLQAMKEAGAALFRTACLSGRRYETFDSAAAWREFSARSWESLTLAEPALRKHGVRMAVENHKDWRVPEMLDLLKRLGSSHVGICVDTGNSISLLEDPMAVIEAYAPLALTVHLKDVAVAGHEDGFLMSEVPLGQGMLDLPKAIETLRRANPSIRFNLEMLTRDPLQIPCLTQRYWATLEAVPGSHLARALTMVRSRAAKMPLPKVAGLSAEARLKAEDDNVRASFVHARAHLGL